VQNLKRVAEHHDRHSSQLDVIVYDFDAFPVFELGLVPYLELE